jgi:hypothetical protein
MKKTTLFLIGAIVSLILFIGFLGESEPKTLFGFSINIWFYRIFWLLNTAIIFKAYLTEKKSKQK